MARQQFKLEGVKELKANLDALGKEMATKVGVKATRAAANELRNEIKAKAPYDPSDTKRTWKTASGEVKEADYGHLRDNIKTRKVRARKAHTISFITTTGKAFWGRFVEFGTEKMGAQPYFKPAIDSAAGRAVQKMVDELKKGIARAAKGARKR